MLAQAIVQVDSELSTTSDSAALRRPLSDLVQSTLQSAARSDHTRRAYITSIGLFITFLDRERGGLLPAHLGWRPLAVAGKVESVKNRRKAIKTVWTFNGPSAVLRLVDASLLDGFRAWREAEGDGPNAASVRVYAVRSFLSVALRDGVLANEQGLALGLKPYRQHQARDVAPVGRRLTREEVKVLRAAPSPDSCKGKRDLALLDCMLYLGLRAEEAASLRLDDFKQDGGRWWVELKGKGGKSRRLKISDALFTSLSAWLAVAGGALGVGNGYLLRNVNKGQVVGCNGLNANVIGRLVSELGHSAALAPQAGQNRLAPHDLRRTCARNAYDNGANLLLIQAMLGHSDPKTTAHYIGAFDDDGQTAVDFVRY